MTIRDGVQYIVPFGLTFAEPVPTREVVDSRWHDATLDPLSQVAVLDGRPYIETVRGGPLAGSSPTETDGKDPIAVDSDTLYD